MILGLKVDVCTYDGLRVGVPNLLRLFDRHGVRASFFVAVGPDTTGRAILRALRPGFLAKMRRTSALRTYGLRTILSGTLLPSRHMGRRLAPLLRQVVAAGHELAIHGYDHRRWQDRVHGMEDRAVREEIGRAVAIYREVAGRDPRGFGAPGWQVSAASLRILDEAGFVYASDTRGKRPFFPRVDGRTLRTLQLPTTLPTLDELLRLDGMSGEDFVGLVGRELEGSAWGVLTLHAEMEVPPPGNALGTGSGGGRGEDPGGRCRAPAHPRAGRHGCDACWPRGRLVHGSIAALAMSNSECGMRNGREDIPHCRFRILPVVPSYAFLQGPLRLVNSQFFPLLPRTRGSRPRACSLAMRLGESLKR
ncbi:MAG: polysaccharide deacetylase family protein [candidate division NC10 bacterium]|nr:polysaccharide deacetylase family protein [candidate division NC10 bacterium]